MSLDRWCFLFLPRYTKRYYENGTNEHAISIGQAQVDNLLPDDRYRTILTSNCQQQQTMIRVYCKEGEPIGGIPVKEHLGKWIDRFTEMCDEILSLL